MNLLYSFHFNRKRCVYSMLVCGWLISLAVVLTGCEPTSDNTAADPAAEPNIQAAAPESEQPAKPAIVARAGSVDAVVERILAGDFVGAKQTCDFLNTGSDAQMAQLANILSRYEELQSKREKKRQAAFEEQLAELNKQKAKVNKSDSDPNSSGTAAVDPAADNALAAGKDTAIEDPFGDLDVSYEPNDIDLILAAAIRARDYAAPEAKGAVLEDPFVQQAIQKARAAAEQYEKEGKWIEAYGHCYYWLTLLYEDDKHYKDYAEKLTELAMIELSLKKSDCGESARQRYEGIEPYMFVRALQALETNYVNGLDYALMCEKAIQRCRLLGRVLTDSKEELGWRADPGTLEKWNAGIDSIEAAFRQEQGDKTLRSIAQLFDDMMELNETSLAVPKEVVVAHFAEAALSALDPFTNLVWPWNVKDFEKSMTQQFSGIGVEISKATGVLKIGSLLPDTPAYRAGLDADDEILNVNGEPTDKMSIYCAVQKITGPKGTKVTITVRRPSTGKTWDVTIVRDRIVVQPLRGWQRKPDGQWDWIVDPANRIAYVRLTTFTETSGPDLDAVLKQLEKDGLNGLILDLRYNPGGYLSSAAEVADLFVREGVIVKSSPRNGFASYDIAHTKGTHPDYPLVILINEGSASASEIVAGALQDPKHNRATLVGERSYGKGSVQVVTPYTGGGSQLKYTVAYYHLPSDQQVKNRYQMEKLGRKDWGIAPDVEVVINTAELREMLQMQRDNDVLVQADHDEASAPTKRSSLAQTLDSDPQLATGLLVLQTKLIRGGRELVFPSDPNTIVLKK